jgi:hypothetical protein
MERFHALGGGRHPQSGTQAGNRPRDRRRVSAMRQVSNERLVDLDLVERKVARIAQDRSLKPTGYSRPWLTES